MRLILRIFLAVVMMVAFGHVAEAKKPNVDLDHPLTVEMTGVSSGGYFVKAWAVAKNADKAIEQARKDAFLAALKTGITASANTSGVTNLPALMTPSQFEDHRIEIAQMITSGEYLNYVQDVSSTYPKGADNVKSPNGRKVGLSLVIDYSGLRAMLQKKGWTKGLNDHFEYKGN